MKKIILLEFHKVKKIELDLKKKERVNILKKSMILQNNKIFNSC